MFDGFFIVGWKGIEVFDMILCLDVVIGFIDLFFVELIVVVICDVIELLIG